MEELFPDATAVKELKLGKDKQIIHGVVTEYANGLEVQFFFDYWNENLDTFLFKECDLEKEFGRAKMHEVCYDIACDYEKEII